MRVLPCLNVICHHWELPAYVSSHPHFRAKKDAYHHSLFLQKNIYSSFFTFALRIKRVLGICCPVTKASFFDLNTHFTLSLRRAYLNFCSKRLQIYLQFWFPRSIHLCSIREISPLPPQEGYSSGRGVSLFSNLIKASFCVNPWTGICLTASTLISQFFFFFFSVV